MASWQFVCRLVLMFLSSALLAMAAEPSCWCLEELVSARDLRNPIRLINAGDGSRMLFIAEQVGIVHAFHANGTKLTPPFMDISHLVLTSDQSGAERGFLDLRFHPDYRTNRKLYVLYSFRHDAEEYVRVSEFLMTPGRGHVVNDATQRSLLEIYEPFTNHNGGQLWFGTDGYLYIAIGDGGSGGDPLDQSQDRSVLRGKISRIDVNRQCDGLPYCIPADNPFVNELGVRGEIWSYGWRNPWRCDMDPGDRNTSEGRGRTLCADVGQNSWEEVDVSEKGGNYGWPAYEAMECYRSELCGNIGPVTWPVFHYNRTVGQCIIGGHFYRGCQNPELNGMYLLGDYGLNGLPSGRLMRMKYDSQTGKWDSKVVTTCSPEVCTDGLTSDFREAILSFGVDEDGEVYMLSTDDPSPLATRGRVYKIIDPFTRGQPCTLTHRQALKV